MSDPRPEDLLFTQNTTTLDLFSDLRGFQNGHKLAFLEVYYVAV